MELFDLKGRSAGSPLNAREISQLYRLGYLAGRHPCKPRGEVKWSTIDEVFPGLKIQAAAGPLRFEEPNLWRKGFRTVAVGSVIVALLATAAFRLRLAAPTRSVQAAGTKPIAAHSIPTSGEGTPALGPRDVFAEQAPAPGKGSLPLASARNKSAAARPGVE